MNGIQAIFQTSPCRCIYKWNSPKAYELMSAVQWDALLYGFSEFQHLQEDCKWFTKHARTEHRRCFQDLGRSQRHASWLGKSSLYLHFWHFKIEPTFCPASKLYWGFLNSGSIHLSALSDVHPDTSQRDKSSQTASIDSYLYMGVLHIKISDKFNIDLFELW